MAPGGVVPQGVGMTLRLDRRILDNTPKIFRAPDAEPSKAAEPERVETTTRTATTETAETARAAHAASGAWAAHQLHQKFEATTAFLANEENFEVLSGGDDHITKEDLERVRDGDVEATDAQRDHARFVLASPSFRNALDIGAGRGDVDDKISRDDVDAVRTELSESDWSGPTIGVDGAIDSKAEARIVLERYGLLSDAAAGKGSKNGHFSEDDAAALLDDPNIPADLRAAARFIVDGEIDLPSDGTGWRDRLSNLPGDIAGAIGGEAADVAGDIGDVARGGLLPPESLSDERRAELLDAAEAAADRPATDLPLNEQRNAHLTNSSSQMLDALEGDYQWLEGDVRRDPPVMGHDYHQAGLTLDDWLEIGNASGLGLKLDIKESRSIDGLIEAVERADIPSDRLMINVDALAGPGGSGYNVSPADVERLREAFPGARISIGAKTGGQPEGTTYTESQVNEMIALAERVGGPVLFPLRAEFVTPEIVERLSPHGDVSIWNSPRTHRLEAFEVEAEVQRFRDMGVTGVIDLRDVDGH